MFHTEYFIQNFAIM